MTTPTPAPSRCPPEPHWAGVPRVVHGTRTGAAWCDRHPVPVSPDTPLIFGVDGIASTKLAALALCGAGAGVTPTLQQGIHAIALEKLAWF